MRIRTAIFGVYVVACAIGLAVLMRFILGEVRPRYVQSLQRNLDDSARLLSASLMNRTEQEVAAIPFRHPGSRVRVHAADGALLLDSARAAGSPDYLEPTRSMATRAVEDFSDFPDRKVDAELSAAAPVRFSDGKVGRVTVSRSVRSLNEVIWTERLKLAGVTLAIAAVMVVAGWWIAAKLTHSLERLTLYAQSVRDGRPVAPPASRAREIAALAQAFEEMRDALEAGGATGRPSRTDCA